MDKRRQSFSRCSCLCLSNSLCKWRVIITVISLKSKRHRQNSFYNFTMHISIHFILQSVVYILMSVFSIRSVSQGEYQPCNSPWSTSLEMQIPQLGSISVLQLRFSENRSSINFKNIQDDSRPHSTGQPLLQIANHLRECVMSSLSLSPCSQVIASSDFQIELD